METTAELIHTAKDINRIFLQVIFKLFRGLVMKTKRTYDTNTIWKNAEWRNKKVNISYIYLCEYSLKRNLSNIWTYRVTEASTSDTARHPIITYVGVCSRLDTATKHTVIEFPIIPMQTSTDAAITTYVLAIVLRVFLMHSLPKTNIKLFSAILLVSVYVSYVVCKLRYSYIINA